MIALKINYVYNTFMFADSLCHRSQVALSTILTSATWSSDGLKKAIVILVLLVLNLLQTHLVFPFGFIAPHPATTAGVPAGGHHRDSGSPLRVFSSGRQIGRM